jgi:transposase-like protein
MNIPSIESILQAEAGVAGALFRELIQHAVRTTFAELVESELIGLCGPRYNPTDGGDFYRAGSAMSSVYFDGKKHPVRRPRVREHLENGSREVSLKILEAAKDSREWEDLMMRGVLCGVSCRDQKTLHPDQFNGMSHASISQLWIRRASELVAEVNEADLSDMPLLGLWVDGTVLAEGVHAIIALGLSTDGRKRVLGFAIGGSENKEVCTDLMKDLVHRGLKPACKRPLAVLDGSAALKAAVLAVWPTAVIQRCLVHKERNLYAYLAKKYHPKLKRFFARLRKAQGGEAADEIIEELENWLGGINAQALASLKEAGEELTAFHHLGAPSTLNRSFLSTNHIENLMLNLKRHLGRVKRWRQETDMVNRWVASGLSIATRGFRRIQNHGSLPALVDALNLEAN